MSRTPTNGSLGRGFASLLPDGILDVDAKPADRGPLRVVPLDEIRPNPEQPRTVFDPEELASLAESIAAHGILMPLIVRRHEGSYALIAGERRLRAAGLAGLHEVPVIVRSADDGVEQLELALVENLQRADLDPIECALGFQRLIVDFGMTQEQVARRVGKNRATIANAVRLLRLPTFVLQAVQEGRISGGHARALLPLTDEEQLRRALAKVIAQDKSVRATERMVAELVRVRTVTLNDRRSKERTLEYATKLLTDALHTDVQIRPRKKGGGRIVIDYSSAEELERLITHLRKKQRAG